MRGIATGLAALTLAACQSGQDNHENNVLRADEAVKLFSQSCVAYQADAAQVSAWAGRISAQPLSADDIKKLPFGTLEPDASAAWKISRHDTAYYLTLTQGSCSLKAEKADETTLRTRFVQLVEQEKKDTNAEFRGDHATQTPFPFKQLAYAWRTSGSGSEILLMANTSLSEQLPVQAALYLTHQNYFGNMRD